MPVPVEFGKNHGIIRSDTKKSVSAKKGSVDNIRIFVFAIGVAMTPAYFRGLCKLPENAIGSPNKKVGGGGGL